MSADSAVDRERIGRGRTAQVVAWGPGQVLKLFRPDFPSWAIDSEAASTRAAHAAGLPVPRVFDVVQVDGRIGIVYERVDGPSMQDLLDRGMSDYTPMARTLGRLHAQLHERPGIETLATAHSLIAMQIGSTSACPEDVRTAALARLEALPNGDRLYHGDFHPGNVLLTARGPVVIDWTCGRVGDPAADVARSMLLMTVHEPAGEHPMAALFRTFRRAYLRSYRSIRPLDQDRVRAWRLPLLAARLSEWPPPEEKRKVLAELRALAG